MKRALLFLLILAVSAGGAVPAAGEDPFGEAYAFYSRFGAGVMVPQGETLYFCTRAKLAAGSETTYRTLGYSIRLKNEEGDFLTESAVGESIRRVSRTERREAGMDMEYALYSFDGGMLYKRLKLSCPEEMFLWFFQKGRRNTILADAIMTIARGGRPLGSVRENDRGTVDESGLIYRDEASIRAAAPWSSGNDFSSEFNILLTITMENLFPPVLVRTVDLPYLALLPEQSLWKNEKLLRLLEASLHNRTPLETVVIPREERRFRQRMPEAGP